MFVFFRLWLISIKLQIWASNKRYYYFVCFFNETAVLRPCCVCKWTCKYWSARSLRRALHPASSCRGDLGAAVGQPRRVWFRFHHVWKSHGLRDNLCVSWYFRALLDPVHAILKSSDVNLPFGTIRDDSVEKKGKKSSLTPRGDSVFHSTSKPSCWCGCGGVGPAWQLAGRITACIW